MCKCYVIGWVLVLAVALLSGGEVANAQQKKASTTAELKGVKNLVYSPDGSFLVISYRSFTTQRSMFVEVWDAKTGKFRVGMVNTPYDCERIAVSPDSKKVAAISVGQRQLKVWDATTGKMLEEHTLPKWRGSIVSAPFLEFSADGKFLYSIRDKKILEVKLGGKYRLFGDKLKVVYDPARVVFDPAGKRMIVAQNLFGQPAADLHVYNLAKNGELQTVRLTGHVQAMALSRDGKTLAISYLGSRKPRFELSDVPAFKLRSKLKPDDRKSFAYYSALVFAPDGKMIAGVPRFTRGLARFVDILNLEGKQSSYEITKNSYVRSLSFSPNGTTLAAVLGNDTIVLVDPATGRTK